MNLHTLELFKKTAELEHLTKASNELHIAQPSLSRSISSLEEELGVELFDRTGKNIVLNEYGKIVLKHTNVIFKEIENITTEIADYNEEVSKTISFGMLAGTQWLTDLVVGFSETHPETKLTIRQSIKPSELDDLDLYTIASEEKITDYNHITLLKERILLALPEEHPLAKKGSIDLREAKNLEFVCLPKGRSMREMTDKYCAMAGFEPNVSIECDSPQSVRQFVSSGHGVSFIPELTWGDVKGKNIVLRRMSYPEGYRYLYLVSRKNAYQTKTIREFQQYIIDWITEKIERTE